MSIAEPTAFTKSKSRGTVQYFIVSLTDGSDTWLLGNFSGLLSDGHVYKAVADFRFTERVQFVQKTLSRTVVSLTIDNIPYKQSSDGWTRLSQDLEDIMSKAAYIYVTADPDVSSLSDCLCIFDGITRQIDQYNGTTLRVDLEDHGYDLDKEVLTSTMKEYVR